MCLTGRVPRSRAFLPGPTKGHYDEPGLCEHSRHASVEHPYAVPPMIASATT